MFTIFFEGLINRVITPQGKLYHYDLRADWPEIQITFQNALLDINDLKQDQ